MVFLTAPLAFSYKNLLGSMHVWTTAQALLLVPVGTTWYVFRTSGALVEAWVETLPWIVGGAVVGEAAVLVGWLALRRLINGAKPEKAKRGLLALSGQGGVSASAIASRHGRDGTPL
jgi:hypothetical protein